MGLVPLAWDRRFLEALFRFVGRFDARHARIIEENLNRAFPEESPAWRKAVGREGLGNWGRMASELAHAEELYTPEVAAAWVPVRAKVEELAKRGRGVLILTAHCGNFEMLARHWGLGGGQIALFHRPMTNQWINQWLLEDRLAMGVHTIERGTKVRAVLRYLRRGTAVAAPMDQNQLPGRGVFVDHFGTPASTSTMLARLSEAFDAPVLPVYAYWEGDLSWPSMGEVIEPSGPASPSHGFRSRDDKLLALTQAYTQSIEAMIRRFPSQWNWAHRRWKTQPPS